ncbi:MAG: MFS transporter, partial [Alphaproteobacteria bacterium]|nr:MFS transporter [Alphaproteobacteria bacterium]
LGNAAMAPIIGRLLDRVSVRKLMMASSLLFAGSMAVISQSRSLALDAALIAAPVAAGVLGGGTISISVMLARWFKLYRARAMALAALGMSLGGIVVAPVIGKLIELQGWRFSVLATGLASGLITASLAFLMRDLPGPGDVEVRGQPTSGGVPSIENPPAASVSPASPPPKVIDILRMRLFWILVGGIAFGGAVGQGVTVSLVPIALEAGLTTMQGAVLISATGISGLAAMLALVAWGDRMDRTALLALVLLSSVVPCALLLVAKTYLALIATALILGIALQVVAPVYIALMADRFGLAAFGTVRGLMVPVMSLVGAVSVRFIGEVYDRTGGYEVGLWTYLVLGVLASGMVFSTRPARA